ncbi:MAG: hypothetical protein ACOZFS_10070, partial [Thermodesulfobacteriota bacterium]
MRSHRPTRIYTCLAMFLALLLAMPIAGWAAKDSTPSPEIGGRGEGFQPEGQEAEKKEEPKEDECPATFGPIITD